jgi:hypothetical protein
MLVADPRKLESVAGNYGSDVLPYEYCTITELATSLASALQKIRQPTLGDDIESLVFNTAQGARFPDGKANAYYAHDSQWQAVLDQGRPATFRYQYAALHTIACCNINSHRILPTYVENMWMKSADGRTLVAALHGASQVTTRLAGCPVQVAAKTDYPFGHRVEYCFKPEWPVEFSLLVRTPAWSPQTRVEAPGARVDRSTGLIRISKTWRAGDVAVVDFEDPVRVNRFRNGGRFVQKGALIYALGFEVEKVPTKQFARGAFANYNLKLARADDREKYLGCRMPAGADPLSGRNPDRLVYRSCPGGDSRFPFDHPPGIIEGRFVYKNEPLDVRLLPMGSLLLRKVLFEQVP